MDKRDILGEKRSQENHLNRYTQQDVDAIPRDENGIKHCPTGEYEAGIKFPEGCSLGKGCSLGERCKAISPFWGHMNAPTFQIEGRIYPPAETCHHWAERLGRFKIAVGDSCYEPIWNQIKPKIKQVLDWDGWSLCERMILESWAKADQKE